MKKEPKAICQNCSKTVVLKPDTSFHKEILKRYTLPSEPSLYPISTLTDNSFSFQEPLKEYPPTLPYHEICKDCRENAACMYDTALLANIMASEYFENDEFFTEEFNIEKRWNMNIEEIKQKSEELRNPLSGI